MSEACRLLLLALAVAGCSSEAESTSDWMLGTFSNSSLRAPTYGAVPSVAHYEFREDGTLAVSVLLGCGTNQAELLHEYKWWRDGDSQVIVEIPPPENEVFQAWIITRGEDCNTLQVHQIQHGDPVGGPTLHRGKVCPGDLPPCKEEYVECYSCGTVWCDEPPPACEG